MIWLKICMGCLAYLFVFYFLVYTVGGSESRKIKRKEKEQEERLFEKMRANFALVPINKNVYYYKGAYITKDYFISCGLKSKHHKKDTLLYNLLRLQKTFN